MKTVSPMKHWHRNMLGEEYIDTESSLPLDRWLHREGRSRSFIKVDKDVTVTFQTLSADRGLWA